MPIRSRISSTRFSAERWAETNRRPLVRGPADAPERTGIPFQGTRHAGDRQARGARRSLRDGGCGPSERADTRTAPAFRGAEETRESLMNLNKYTEKAQEVVVSAHRLAGDLS